MSLKRKRANGVFDNGKILKIILKVATFLTKAKNKRKSKKKNQNDMVSE